MSATSGSIAGGPIGDPALDSEFVKEVKAYLADGGVTPSTVQTINEHGVKYCIAVATEDPRTAPSAWSSGGMSMIIRAVTAEGCGDTVFAGIEIAVGFIQGKETAPLIEHIATHPMRFLSPFRMGYYQEDEKTVVLFQAAFPADGLTKAYRVALLDGILGACRMEFALMREKFGLESFYPATAQKVAA